MCKVTVSDPLHPARHVIAFCPLWFRYVLLGPRDLRRKPRILPELALGKHREPYPLVTWTRDSLSPTDLNGVELHYWQMLAFGP